MIENQSRPKATLARPTVLTPEVKATILGSLAGGNFLSTACSTAGIHPNTFRYWRRLAYRGTPSAVPHADFFGRVDRALAIGEVVALRRIIEGKPGWQGAAWFLGRRHPERWGGKRRRAERVPPKPMEDMTDAELEAFARSLG